MKKITVILLCILSITLNAQRQLEIITKNTMDGQKSGMVDKVTRDTILKVVYDKINTYSEGFLDVQQNNKWGIVDAGGKTILPCNYNYIQNVHDGRLFAALTDKFALFDNTGKKLTDYIFDYASFFSNGVALVQMNGNPSIGAINKAGTLIIPCKFSKNDPIKNGIVTLYTDKWETFKTYNVVQFGKVIDQVNVGTTLNIPIIFNNKGKVIYKSVRDESVHITDASIIVTTKTLGWNEHISQMIDSSGKILIPYEDNKYLEVDDYWIQVHSKTGVGLIGLDGKEILKCKFGSIIKAGMNYSDRELLEKNWYEVHFRDGNDFFYIDTNGKCVEYKDVKCPE